MMRSRRAQARLARIRSRVTEIPQRLSIESPAKLLKETVKLRYLEDF